MKIVSLRERTVPIGSAMRNASIGFGGMTASALAVVTDRVFDGKPLVGYAFDSIGRYAKGGLLRERFIPRLLAAAPDTLLDSDGIIDPDACARVLMQDEKEGGHGERPGAVGLLDAALWDARAKMQGLPLWRALAQHYGTVAASGTIRVYGSCGHFRPDAPGSRATDGLRDEVQRVADAGYRLVKIKVGGEPADEKRIEAAAKAMGGSSRVAVDVNGKLEESRAKRWFAMTGERGVAFVEEPAPPLDYALLARYAAMAPGLVATGENLFSFDDARNLLRYGALRSDRDLLQFDPLLAYGVGEYQRIIAAYTTAGWRRDRFVPHAGHLFAAHVVAGLGLGMHEAAPDPTLAYGGFWDGTKVEDGAVRIPDHPGAGFEAKANLFALLSPLGDAGFTERSTTS
ncbi:MAG: mandelate racemase [Betaproteobacteria bacterium]|nr:mandelate racemase [Betaproteobacteria bacterium]